MSDNRNGRLCRLGGATPPIDFLDLRHAILSRDTSLAGAPSLKALTLLPEDGVPLPGMSTATAEKRGDHHRSER